MFYGSTPSVKGLPPVTDDDAESIKEPYRYRGVGFGMINSTTDHITNLKHWTVYDDPCDALQAEAIRRGAQVGDIVRGTYRPDGAGGMALNIDSVTIERAGEPDYFMPGDAEMYDS